MDAFSIPSFSFKEKDAKLENLEILTYENRSCRRLAVVDSCVAITLLMGVCVNEGWVRKITRPELCCENQKLL